jgi:hypothetical protein
VRALKKLVLSGAAALALLGGTAAAGTSEAIAAPAVQTTGRAAAHPTSPNEFGIQYGPYDSRNLCEVNLATVEQDWPPPISATGCYQLVTDPVPVQYRWFFTAYYDV